MYEVGDTCGGGTKTDARSLGGITLLYASIFAAVR